MVAININGKDVNVDVPDDTPLLWVIREELGLKGTKFGCGKGLCGSCTVILNGIPTRTCILPVSASVGQKIKTIESQSTEKRHPVQEAWIKHNVPQCGYCQSGQIMLAIGLLDSQERWEEEALIAAMSANICRCGTYNRIKRAIKDAAKEMGKIS